MQLLVISSTFPTDENDPIGGFILDFCNLLSKHHSIAVLTQKRKEQYAIPDNIKLITFNWRGKNKALSDLNIFNPIHVFYAYSFFKNIFKAGNKFISSNKVDAVFALWAIPSGIIAYRFFLKKNIPYYTWCLGSDIWKHKNNIFTRSLLKKILRNSTQVFADGFDFCVEIENFSDANCQFLASSRILSDGLPVDSKQEIKTYVFIGRYHQNKGPDVLMRAIMLLPETILKNSEFYFYGTGIMQPKLKSIAEENKHLPVKILGILDKKSICEVLHRAHFLIIPSRIDSIPVILSDSLQCYTPVIGANVGDLGKIIKKYQLGYVFQKENEKELAEKIILSHSATKSTYHQNIASALSIFSTTSAVQLFIKKINHEE